MQVWRQTQKSGKNLIRMCFNKNLLSNVYQKHHSLAPDHSLQNTQSATDPIAEDVSRNSLLK